MMKLEMMKKISELKPGRLWYGDQTENWSHFLSSKVQSPAIATQRFFALFSDDARATYGQSEKSEKKCWVAIAGDCTSPIATQRTHSCASRIGCHTWTKK